MKNLTVIQKIFAYTALTSGALWAGAYITRLSVTYVLFEEENFVLKNFVTSVNLEGILKTISPAITLSFILYIILILSFTLFLFTSHINFKQNGWLFIIAVLIYFTLPFQVYLLIKDFKLITILNSTVINSDSAVYLIKQSFETLNGFPIIILLCYISIPYFLIFKPFNKTEKNEN